MRSVILLRGINVGGHRKLPMEDLRNILITLGAQNPKTYIQSGNVVIDGQIDSATLSDEIEKAKGFRPNIMAFPAETFKEIAAEAPVNEPNGKFLHIWFTTTQFNFNHEIANTLIVKSETIHCSQNAIFLHAPEGIGRSKLAAKIEALAGVPCTARNMNTVRKLLEMLDG